MAKRVSERRLVDVLIHHVRSEHAAAREVGHYEKRIDVALLRRDTDEVWAIEAKTANWLRAISQAIVNLCAADRSYIAVFAGNVHRVDVDMLDAYGIGLISVGTKWGDVQFLREAKRSPYVNALALRRVKAQIAAGG